jgi:nucleoid-associated protein Lsr2
MLDEPQEPASAPDVTAGEPANAGAEPPAEDDLDGGPADETVRFALDGRDFEIHLSAANAERLRASLRPYVAAARRVRAPRRPPSPRARNARIRAWARAQGIVLSPSGRIPNAVIEQYDAAH